MHIYAFIYIHKYAGICACIMCMCIYKYMHLIEFVYILNYQVCVLHCILIGVYNEKQLINTTLMTLNNQHGRKYPQKHGTDNIRVENGGEPMNSF